MMDMNKIVQQWHSGGGNSEFIESGCFEVVPQQIVKTVYVSVK